MQLCDGRLCRLLQKSPGKTDKGRACGGLSVKSGTVGSNSARYQGMTVTLVASVEQSL